MYENNPPGPGSDPAEENGGLLIKSPLISLTLAAIAIVFIMAIVFTVGGRIAINRQVPVVLSGSQRVTSGTQFVDFADDVVVLPETDYQRLIGFENQLAEIDRKITELDSEIGSLNTKVDQVSGDTTNLYTLVGNVDGKVTNIETSVNNLPTTEDVTSIVNTAVDEQFTDFEVSMQTQLEVIRLQTQPAQEEQSVEVVTVPAANTEEIIFVDENQILFRGETCYTPHEMSIEHLFGAAEMLINTDEVVTSPNGENIAFQLGTEWVVYAPATQTLPCRIWTTNLSSGYSLVEWSSDFVWQIDTDNNGLVDLQSDQLNTLQREVTETN